MEDEHVQALKLKHSRALKSRRLSLYIVALFLIGATQIPQSKLPLFGFTDGLAMILLFSLMITYALDRTAYMAYVESELCNKDIKHRSIYPHPIFLRKIVNYTWKASIKNRKQEREK